MCSDTEQYTLDLADSKLRVFFLYKQTWFFFVKCIIFKEKLFLNGLFIAYLFWMEIHLCI